MIDLIRIEEMKGKIVLIRKYGKSFEKKIIGGEE